MNTDQTRWKMVILLCATATVGYICRVNISIAAPLLMKEFSLSQAEMGRVFSAFLLGYALFQVPSGLLADRWGTRTIFGMAAWLWAGFTILQSGIGWGPLAFMGSATLGIFMFIRLLLGIAASPTYPAAAKGVSKWIPPAMQGRANGIVIASIGLGAALAPPLVSHLMVYWGWRPALMVTALPVILVAFIWRGTREPGSVINSHTAVHSETTLVNTEPSPRLVSRDFILLTVSYSLQGYVGYIFVSWFYLYLVQERHFGLLAGGWFSSLPWVLSILSIPLGGLISDRLAAGRLGAIWGRRLIPMVGMGFSGILISIGAHTGNAIVAAIALAFATALVLCVEGPFWTMMIRLSGPKSGRAGGIMNMGSNLGGLLSPALTPWLAEKIGWENALHLAAVFAIIAAVLWCWIRPYAKQPSH